MWLFNKLPVLFCTTALRQSSDPFQTSLPIYSALSGLPISPIMQNNDDNSIIIRYMYDGGVISNGRICVLPNKDGSDDITSSDLHTAIENDGVDLNKFYISIYENEVSDGGWFPIYNSKDDNIDDDGDNNQTLFTKSSNEDSNFRQRRIDIKLFRRPLKKGLSEQTVDAAHADAMSQTTGKLPSSLGYYGVGVIGAKTQANVGTLWRSAYQLGASFLVTIGQRYRVHSTDTVQAPTRIPLFEMDDWSAFAKFAPRGAKWVAIEMGGTPLQNFDHPKDAIYILGAEDSGVPKSVLRSCHEVVSLDSVQYASYNVAVAASIVLYDRMQKIKSLEKKENSEKIRK